MNIAVITLCRDRLPYTQHCFGTLRELAGCDYDHYVIDQASSDGTWEWLRDQDDLDATQLTENIGVNQALNLALDELLNPADYDVIVKVDNDCELLTPNTLRDVGEASRQFDALLSPTIHGLRQPPAIIDKTQIEGQTIARTAVIGGIFLAAPARIFRDGYRHDEAAPVWGDDEGPLCAMWRRRGGIVGYLEAYDANHYLTTDGQVADIPEYFERRVAEGGRPQ